MTDGKYPLALPQGSVLAGQYIIEQVLGQGGFGITYKAQDHKSGQKVAIKEFFPDSMATRTQTAVTAFAGERAESFAYGKACFLQEAGTLAEFIGNENIVRVHSYFEENQTAYFVMDFVEGISFDRYIKEHGGRVTYEEAEKIVLPVIDALAAVHRRGIVHRDVTPDNIYIADDGIVKLLDFGAARYSLGDKSRSLDVVLKHGFAPKEQYTRHGKQGPFTDIYTLGASFYFAITGRRPPDSIDRLEEDELIPPGNLGVSIPEGREEAILKAMSVQPSERFQSMEAFKQALVGAPVPQTPVQQRIFIAPTPQSLSVEQYERTVPQPKPASVPQQQPAFQPEKKKPFLWAGIGAGAVAVIAVIAVAVSTGSKAKPADNTNDNEMVHYDLLEEQPEQPEPEAEKIISDTIQGNTSDNISREGLIAAGDSGVALAYPGGKGLVYIDDDNAALLDDTGKVRCISMIGDTIYYVNKGKINWGTAYRINRNGTNKEKIPQLENYDKIASLYISEEYFYIYQYNDGLFCINRSSGALLGTIARVGSLSFTFLDGNLYYFLSDLAEDETSKLYRLPADDFGAQPELLLDFDKVGECYQLASEGNYVYGIYKDEIEDATSFFQYDVSKDEMSWRYNFYKESWPGYFFQFNVADQYVYFTYEPKVDESDGESIPAVYRFRAEMDGNAENFNVELICEGAVGQTFSNLLLLKNQKMAAVHLWELGGYDGIKLADMDGEGEPVIIDNRDLENE